MASFKSGAWATTSQDLLWVVVRLFHESRSEASQKSDKNNSGFVYAGIPLLLAAVWSFAVEYEGMLHTSGLPAELAGDSLTKLMETRYRVSGELLDDLRDLVEIRNEILHPVPLPTGTPDNWPDYLRRVKQKGLLTTSGSPNCDYVMLGQIASHKLFAWAVDVTKHLYRAIVYSNPAKVRMFQAFLGDNFSAFFG
jgi:hypothetical protein